MEASFEYPVVSGFTQFRGFHPFWQSYVRSFVRRSANFRPRTGGGKCRPTGGKPENQIPIIALLLLSAALLAGSELRSAGFEGAYAQAQATRGKDSYARYCADCHDLTLRGSAHGGPLKGPEFLVHWGDRSAGDLLTYISTRMSSAVPSSADPAMLVDITAYLLSVNGASAGDWELASGSSVGIGPAVMGAAWSESPHAGAQGAGAGPGQHTWSGAGSIAAEAERAAGFVNHSTPPVSPVTDPRLPAPPPPGPAS